MNFKKGNKVKTNCNLGSDKEGVPIERGLEGVVDSDEKSVVGSILVDFGERFCGHNGDPRFKGTCWWITPSDIDKIIKKGNARNYVQNR